MRWSSEATLGKICPWHDCSQEMQKCDAVDAKSDGTVPKNARCCTGTEVDTNRNVKHYFSLLQKAQSDRLANSPMLTWCN